MHVQAGQTDRASPWWMLTSPWRHRSLLTALVRRDIVARYRGSMLGVAWSFIQPLLLLIVYSFVFSVVFKARWRSDASASQSEFALVLFAGLIPYQVFADVLQRAPGLVVSHANYVKKVIFPLEILPWVTVGAALVQALISCLVWVVVYVVLMQRLPSITLLLTPLVFVPLVFLSAGAAWLFASLGVYLRDLSQLVGLLITVLMFVSPIFYPLSALPEAYRDLARLNPLTDLIELQRAAMYWGEGWHWLSWFKAMAVSLLLAALGFAWFQKTRKGFADVL